MGQLGFEFLGEDARGEDGAWVWVYIYICRLSQINRLGVRTIKKTSMQRPHRSHIALYAIKSHSLA